MPWKKNLFRKISFLRFITSRCFSTTNYNIVLETELHVGFHKFTQFVVDDYFIEKSKRRKEN